MHQNNSILIGDVLEIAVELYKTQPFNMGDPRHVSFGDCINTAVGIQRNRILSTEYINTRSLTENLNSKGLLQDDYKPGYNP